MILGPVFCLVFQVTKTIALGVLAEAVFVGPLLELRSPLVGLLSELAVVLGFLAVFVFSGVTMLAIFIGLFPKLAFAFLAIGILAEAVFVGLFLEFARALLIGLISEHAVALGVSAITIGIAAVTLVELLVPAIALILLMLLTVLLLRLTVLLLLLPFLTAFSLLVLLVRLLLCVLGKDKRCLWSSLRFRLRRAAAGEPNCGSDQKNSASCACPRHFLTSALLCDLAPLRAP